MLKDERRVPYNGDVTCREHYDTYEVSHTGDMGATQHFVTYLHTGDERDRELL